MRAARAFVFLIGMSWLPGSGVAQAPEGSHTGLARISEWLDQLMIQPGVTEELARFRKNGEGLNAAFPRAQVERFRSASLSSLRSALDRILQDGCTSFVEVTFPKPEEWGVTELGEVDEEFLEGVVRTEAVACFQSTVSPGEALEIYTSPTFRMEAESRIEAMWEEGGTTCIHTGGVPLLLSSTETCNQVTRLLEAEVASEHSQVVRNATDEGIQPVFFKESLKTFLSTPGGLAFHYINYSRSVDLGRASRWVAGRKIRDSQQKQVEALRILIEG